MKPIFRHPDKVQRLPLRDFLREHCPTPAEGMVIEDLDLVLRRAHGKGEFGRFRLVEHKYGNGEMSDGQRMTFGLIDVLLRLADPACDHYDGWYVLRTDTADLETLDTWKVNGTPLTRAEFIDWASFGETTVEPRTRAPRFAMWLASRLTRAA